MELSGDLKEVFLLPGAYFVGGPGHRVRTLLGSCVSVTLWHPRRHVGAMSHFVLATRGVAWPEQPDARYGDEAVALLVRGLERMNVAPWECQAKIFGGGDMLARAESSGAWNIGRQNGEAARRLLQEHSIPVVAESLYGAGHRQIIFHVDTGEVWVRQMPVQR